MIAFFQDEVTPEAVQIVADNGGGGVPVEVIVSAIVGAAIALGIPKLGQMWAEHKATEASEERAHEQAQNESAMHMLSEVLAWLQQVMTTSLDGQADLSATTAHLSGQVGGLIYAVQQLEARIPAAERPIRSAGLPVSAGSPIGGFIPPGAAAKRAKREAEIELNEPDPDEETE